MHTLSDEERQTLISIVHEHHGRALSYGAFAGAMLDLFEDIPGFETMLPAKANRIVDQLWSTYHGQETRR